MAAKFYTNIPAMGAVQTQNVTLVTVKPTVTGMWSDSMHLERTSHSLQPCNYVSTLTGKLKAAVPTTEVKRKFVSALLLLYYFI